MTTPMSIPFMPLQLRRLIAAGTVLLAVGMAPFLHATVDDSVSFAYEAALPYYKRTALQGKHLLVPNGHGGQGCHSFRSYL